MLRNRDGSLYDGESVAEAIESAFDERDFPHLSHILGSDWCAGLPAPRDSEHYRVMAYDAARRIYRNDEAGCLVRPPHR